MNSTLKRRMVTYILGGGSAQSNPNPWVAGPSLFEAIPGLPEPIYRAAATELHDEGAVSLKPFNHESLNFFVKPGPRVDRWLQNSKTTKAVAMEVLELLYEQAEAGKSRLTFWDVTGALSELPSGKIQDACHWLVERGVAQIRGGDGAGVVLHIWILSRGKDIIEGTVEESKVEIHHGDRYHIQDIQNSAIAINSEHVVQAVQVEAEVPFAQVAETIRATLGNLPSFGFPADAEKRIRSYLDAAATAVEDDEPDKEHAESSLKKALASAATHADQATKLGTALAPLVPWFAALSLHLV